MLFDGKPEADGQVAAQAKAFYDELAGERKLLTVPADAAAADKLAKTYMNEAVGAISVQRRGERTYFDFGEFASEMASRVNPDGTTSFITIVPGMTGFEFVAGNRGDRNDLVHHNGAGHDGVRVCRWESWRQANPTLRDAQHEYLLREE